MLLPTWDYFVYFIDVVATRAAWPVIPNYPNEKFKFPIGSEIKYSLDNEKLILLKPSGAVLAFTKQFSGKNSNPPNGWQNESLI